MTKILLKPTTLDDYDDYYAIRCSKGDIYWNGYESKPDKKSFRSLFLNRLGNARFEVPEDRRLFLIKLVPSGESVGFLQLIKRTDGIDIGYTVTEEYQRHGYATQGLKLGIRCAKQLDNRLYVQIRDDNIASQKVAVKCGFERTDEFEIRTYPKAGKIALRKYRLNLNCPHEEEV